MKTQVTLGKRTLRLRLCAALLGASLTTLGTHAAVVVDSSASPLSSVPFNVDGFYLNVVTEAVGTSGSAVTGWDLNQHFSGSTAPPAGFSFFSPTGGMIGIGSVVTPLAPGSTIGASSPFTTGFLNANAATPGTSTFGFGFLNEATGVTDYGYVVVAQSANPPVAGSVRALSYAYENTGLSITAPVPEPSTALSLLIGALGLDAVRLRRSATGHDAG